MMATASSAVVYVNCKRIQVDCKFAPCAMHAACWPVQQASGLCAGADSTAACKCMLRLLLYLRIPNPFWVFTLLTVK